MPDNDTSNIWFLFFSVVCIAFGLLMSIATLYDVLAEYWLLPRSESGPQNDVRF